MEINKKIDFLNTYDLITKFLQRPGITSHISKHLSSATMKPVDGVFSSVINDSFIVLKFQESPKSAQYFKYLAYSNTYDRLDISSSKNIIDCGYNNSSFYYILSIGNTFSIITPENEINYETLILKDSIKLSNEIGKKYIIKISCGENHCLFLTHAGMIYTMGDNSYGQLGLGENHITKENKEGILLKDLLNYRINDICAGKNHSFCFGVVRELTKAGNAGPNNNIEFDPKRPYYLFGWGDNSFYQLGMKQINAFNTILRPTKICCNNNLNNPAILGEELINISCGHNFSSLLFRNGKLLTFGDNQYNQIIYKENEFMPNFAHNYLPKKIGKIINVITGGNSLMLMTEFNKLIIFGKYNEPNQDQVTIVNLVDNCENNKYIFNDNILKLIIFNNETSNPNLIKNITNVKIDEFLVNIIKKENPEKDMNLKNNEIINNKPNDNIINKNNDLNIKNNNQKNKTTINKEVNNRTIDANSSKKHLKLNSNISNNSSLKNNIIGEQKKSLAKNLNMKKNKTIKYKNSFTRISHISNDKVIVTDNLNLLEKINTKNKIENKSQYNGAKYVKTYESNGKSSQNQSNENGEELKLNNEENNTTQKIKEKEIINGNVINESENGNIKQNININNFELNNKTFLNKNILQNKKPILQNRYEDNYDSFNMKDLVVENNKNENKKIEENKNNGGNLKNGKNDENKLNTNKLNEFRKEEKNNKNNYPIEIIEDKNNNIIIDINKNKNIETQNKNEFHQNNNIHKEIKNNNNIEHNITNKNSINNDNSIKNNKKNNNIINNENMINNKIENPNNKNNIDNNISNNSIKNINYSQNNKKENQNQNKLIQNIDNNSLTFNNNTNNIQNKVPVIKNIDIIKKESNNNSNNNINNGINPKINKNINNKEQNNKKILDQPKKDDNILISQKKESSNYDEIKNKNINKESNQNKINKISEKENKKAGYLPIKIENIEKKEESKDSTNNSDKKESSNIFRELGQFVSSTMNKINKYTKNRTDIKKDAFFENIISGNFASKLSNINPKILLNNIISGIPNRYRGRFWLKCIGNQLSITPDYFDINLSKYYEKYEETKESKYKLPFPYLGIFKENTPLTLDLCEVINGFVISRPDIKYNEKISYLVGMLIINMDKYQAYVSFMNLILNPNIIIYYLSDNKNEPVMEYGYSDTPTGDEETPKNKNKKIPSIVEKNLRRVIFKQLLFHNLPELCSNLELLNVLPEDYFDEWNQTIFSKNFNVDIAMKIWDLFVVQGEKIIFDAGIALMKELEDELNNCEEKEEALDLLLNSQMKEINESNVMKNIQNVEYPDWIQSEVLNMTEDTIIPINFNKK